MPDSTQGFYLQQGLLACLQYHMISMWATSLPETLSLLKLMEAMDLALAEEKWVQKKAQPPLPPLKGQPPKGVDHKGRQHLPPQQVSGKSYSATKRQGQQPEMKPKADKGETPANWKPLPPHICYTCCKSGHLSQGCPTLC